MIVDRVGLPAYLRIGEKAKHLRELGMSDKAIARSLAVALAYPVSVTNLMLVSFPFSRTVK